MHGVGVVAASVEPVSGGEAPESPAYGLPVTRPGLLEGRARVTQRDARERHQVLGVALGVTAVDHVRVGLRDDGTEQRGPVSPLLYR